ncbi:Hypothetical protein FKW44_009289 [Caligus rogercresseyi]|uniref:Uncharacterized protein n=1 Tax=Caligus rogercresseyi TaxID=217165 RepID=A0A7T8K783_CALRO|nr:Hypothetical protein FKW44_009289 [Caligus rogercresseyi]
MNPFRSVSSASQFVSASRIQNVGTSYSTCPQQYAFHQTQTSTSTTRQLPLQPLLHPHAISIHPDILHLWIYQALVFTQTIPSCGSPDIILLGSEHELAPTPVTNGPGKLCWPCPHHWSANHHHRSSVRLFLI